MLGPVATHEQRQGIGNTFRPTDPDFEPATGHVWVDGDRPGLLLARRQDDYPLLVVWLVDGQVHQQWVEAARVELLPLG